MGYFGDEINATTAGQRFRSLEAQLEAGQEKLVGEVNPVSEPYDANALPGQQRFNRLMDAITGGVPRDATTGNVSTDALSMLLSSAGSNLALGVVALGFLWYGVKRIAT